MPNFFYFYKKRNNIGKGALNPLVDPKPVKPKYIRPVFYSNAKYTRPVFYPNPHTPDPYLTRPPELTGLHESIYTYVQHGKYSIH